MVRALDFDNTIYDGESALDFYLFALRFNPRSVKYIPAVLWNFLKYKLGIIKAETVEKKIQKYAEGYLNSFANLPRIVRLFWDAHMRKIKKWYTPQQSDIIITASFDVLIDEACKRLGVEKYICSRFDMKTYKVAFLNFGENKKKAYQKVFGDKKPDEFYTDSGFDMPMAELAQKAYLVKGNKIRRIK